MPLYEYQCQSCGHRFEKIQSFSAPEEKECPKCGGPVERLISAPAFQFKGAGWYVNDYAGRNKTPASGSSEGSNKSNDGASDNKSTSAAADSASKPAGSSDSATTNSKPASTSSDSKSN